tara:strand:- start:1020 stop:1604 length:585 start_codon:yes stop_codon:yes gene_type:complete
MMKKSLLLGGMCVALFVGGVAVWAGMSMSNGEHNDHAAMVGHHEGQMPLEGGQSAFSSIAEIVTILENDPATDWAKVDISGLREHLVDMNELIVKAQAQTQMSKDQIEFTVTGQGQTIRAIQNMVPAHAKQLAQDFGWKTKTNLTSNGVILSITSDDQNQLEKLSGLGFFGVMATGAHHQQHHLQMAKGNSHFH